MNLFEIDRAIEECTRAVVDEATGEIVGTAIDLQMLEGLQMERDQKVRNIACWMKNLKSDVIALKAQKDAFAARQKSAENKLESLKNYLSAYLDGKAVKETEFAISFRKTKSVNILNEDAVPDTYKVPQAPKVDKAALLADLKAGAEVPGAEIKESLAMTLK